MAEPAISAGAFRQDIRVELALVGSGGAEVAMKYKWLYICGYCGGRTLGLTKRNRLSCEYCGHPAERMKSEEEILDQRKAEKSYEDLMLYGNCTIAMSTNPN